MDKDEIIQKADCLSDRQIRCLMLRLSNKTYKKIGEEMNISGECARQTIARITRKLRYPVVIKRTDGLSLQLSEETTNVNVRRGGGKI